MITATSSVSTFGTLEAIGEFWDEHDFMKLGTDAPRLDFSINLNVHIVNEKRGEE